MINKCVFCAICVLMCISINVHAQTYFYRQIKTVKNGHTYDGDNSYLFVTFTSNGCYDSDKEGISVDNGFLKYIKKSKQAVSYYGDSYWGYAYYNFTADYKRLNIKPDGSSNTLVYIKCSANNEQTCYYIKEKTKVENKTPIIIDRSITIHTNSENSIRGHTERIICSFCKGTGINTACDYAPDYTGGKAEEFYCKVCKRYDKFHTHGACPSCAGTGYTDKYITN